MSWAEAELGGAQLGDRRLTKRLIKLVDALSVAPCAGGAFCAACRAPLDNGEELHAHHVIPKRQGGTDALDNLQLLHLYCHQQLHAHERNRSRLQTA